MIRKGETFVDRGKGLFA